MRGRYDHRLERRHWSLVFWCGLGPGSVALSRWVEQGVVPSVALAGALTVAAHCALLCWGVLSAVQTHRAVERFRRDRGLSPGGPWRLLRKALCGWRAARTPPRAPRR